MPNQDAILTPEDGDILERCMGAILDGEDQEHTPSVALRAPHSGHLVVRALAPMVRVPTILVQLPSGQLVPMNTPLVLASPPPPASSPLPTLDPAANPVNQSDPNRAPPGKSKSGPKVRSRPTCDQCGRDFISQRNLRVHKEEVHEGRRGKYACGDCGRVFTRIRSLERHQNSVHLKDTPKCRLCNKAVVNYDLHFRRFHCKSISVQTMDGVMD